LERTPWCVSLIVIVASVTPGGDENIYANANDRAAIAAELLRPDNEMQET
jgi:hypothetical protein